LSEPYIAHLATKLGKSLKYGEKQQIKNLLLEKLGYNIKLRKVGSLNTIAENITYFVDIGVKDIGRVAERQPPVLEYNIRGGKKPGGKMLDKYITGGTLIEPCPKKTPFSIEDIENFPTALTYSFENRIMPRFEFIRAKQGSLDGWNLPKILIRSDAAFARMLDSSIEELLNLKLRKLSDIWSRLNSIYFSLISLGIFKHNFFCHKTQYKSWLGLSGLARYLSGLSISPSRCTLPQKTA
jgi:hypothetical protein